MAVTFEEAVSRSPLRPFQVMTFTVCLLVLVADGVDLQLLGLIAPAIIAEWGVGRGSFGIAISAALVGMALGAWAGGWIGDRYGRRNTLVGATLVFSLATIATSQAQSIPQMAVLRLLGGLGFGAAFPNSLALASEWLPERWRSYAITALSIGTPIGGSIAAAFAPALLAGHGWRGAFVIFGSITLLFVFVVLGLLRDSPPYLFAKGRGEQARQAAERVLPTTAFPSETIVAAIGAAAAAPGDHDERIGVFHASNRRLNWGVGISFAASTLIMFGMISWVTTFLTASGFTLEQALKAGLSGGIASIIGSLCAGYLSRRFGSRRVLMVVGMALLLSVLALAATLQAQAGPPSDLQRGAVNLLVALVIGIVSLGIATLYVLMTTGYPQSCRGAGIGFGMLTGRVGGISASLGGGFIIDLGAGSLAPFFAILAIAACAISLSAAIMDRHIPPSFRSRG